MTSFIRCDIAVVGAGMAGASLAAQVAPHARVVLIEGEAQPGYHATGRSAAFWSETYGGAAVQPLTSASGPWLRAPPEGFAAGGYLTPRGELHIAAGSGRAALDAIAAEFAGAGIALRRLDRVGVQAIVPGLRPGWDGGLLEPSCCDIDVAALHGDYLRAARRSGAQLLVDARVEAIVRDGVWRIVTSAGEVRGDILVDAAGAWADKVARMAGAAPLGIAAYRRTVSQIVVDPPAAPALPLVVDAEGRFYFKPAAGGRLWLSPHDETPAPAGDVAPEEIDVATAIDRLGQVVDWRVRRVERSWAGLRSFAPDRAPVYGFDPRTPGFFWFAGQGGFGIQTAPAAAQLAAALLLDHEPPVGLDPARYGPGRFDQ